MLKSFQGNCNEYIIFSNHYIIIIVIIIIANKRAHTTFMNEIWFLGDHFLVFD